MFKLPMGLLETRCIMNVHIWVDRPKHGVDTMSKSEKSFVECNQLRGNTRKLIKEAAQGASF
jgi:hypothetical protein